MGKAFIQSRMFENEKAKELFFRMITSSTGEEPCTSDPDVWMETWTEKATPEKAQELCSGCPIYDVCGQFALENKEKLGIWGGTTPAQRKEYFERQGN